MNNKKSVSRRAVGFFLSAALLLGCAAPAGALEPPTVRGTAVYKQLTQPNFDRIGSFSEGMAPVNSRGKWGYVDEEGRLVIPCRYERAWEFHEGLAIVAEKGALPAASGGKETPVYFLSSIDHSGKATPLYRIYEADNTERRVALSIEQPLDELEFAYNGGFVNIGGTLIGRSGHPLRLEGDRPYFAMDDMNEGLAPVQLENNRGDRFFAFADGRGRIAVSFETRRGMTSLHSLRQGAAVFTENNRLGIVSRSGKVISQPILSDAVTWKQLGDSYLADSMGRITVQRASDGLWGAMDLTGKMVIPFAYEGLYFASEGRIAYKKGGKWGYMDSETLKTVVEPRYSLALPMTDGAALVAESDGRVSLIDRWGNKLTGVSDDLLRRQLVRQTGGDYLLGADRTMVYRQGEKYGLAQAAWLPPLPRAEEMSGWAYDEVCRAIEKELVPSPLQNSFRQDMSRREFAQMIVCAAERITGKTAQTLTGSDAGQLQAKYPFRDTNDIFVVQANALGIIAGYPDGTFRPEQKISRQEAAALLTRTAKALGADTSGAAKAGFADTAEIGTWARGDVDYVYQAGIMAGVGQNRFDPAAGYTREQTCATVLRLAAAMGV